MKKIPTLYLRDPDNRARLLPEVHPDCQWVLDGEGQATVKVDGTCCLANEDGQLMKRREVKAGKPIPEGFVEVEHDETTGKRVGWVLVDMEDPSNRWHKEAWTDLEGTLSGTYELIGPKVQGNPEGADYHILVKHDTPSLKRENVPSTFGHLEKWLTGLNIEGIVWHHPDGRMAKIKLKDFGIKRGANQ